MEQEDEDLPPFWLESTTNHRRGGHRRRLLSPSVFLNSGVLVILLLATAILFFFFIIPSVLSFTAYIFRPSLVKKSWDSLNIILVLCALVFGFLSRNRIDRSSFDEDQTGPTFTNQLQKSNPSTPHQWYEYPDRTTFSSAGMARLRRASSSYPDLRELSSWDTGNDRWRFFDDTRVDDHRFSDTDHLRGRRRPRQLEDEDSDTRGIHADPIVMLPQDRPLSPASPPPPIKRKPRRTHKTPAHKEKTSKQVNELQPEKSTSSPSVPPPPPPPPPLLSSTKQKSSKSDRKRGGTNATKDFLTSLYHQRKRKKKQRQKSVDSIESLFESHPPILNAQPATPPPPPPPPPPPSVFHNLFSSKKIKHKRIHSAPPHLTKAVASKTTTNIPSVTVSRPLAPVRISSFNSTDDNLSCRAESPLTGNESPLIPIPPPPPPPPFKMPAWKFVVQGDYVRIQSSNSSRSGSPDLDDVESPPGNILSESGGATAAMYGGDGASPLFCPSPDVDTKADSFIARFRAGLKLEKIDSIQKRRGLGMSNLGPETSPEPGPKKI